MGVWVIHTKHRAHTHTHRERGNGEAENEWYDMYEIFTIVDSLKLIYTFYA